MFKHGLRYVAVRKCCSRLYKDLPGVMNETASRRTMQHVRDTWEATVTTYE
jgi:hypothetical protein